MALEPAVESQEGIDEAAVAVGVIAAGATAADFAAIVAPVWPFTMGAAVAAGAPTPIADKPIPAAPP